MLRAVSLSAGGRPHTLSSLILFEIIWEKRWEEADLSDFYRTKLAFIGFPGPVGTCTLLPSGPGVCNAARGAFA
ncbi:hypothetical protein BwSH20_72760 [Bradyrhizobium ottawaense]|nr:hypothetical protein BJA01nite_78040 [Bradyrhizobium japonicum]GMO35385.1 hypothetical protein BwSF12_35210 [Bradyrhizobium ottawaense]GMO49658.1 hypothetical protein BwSF21_70080 [Bradyrhizobium ottawaense]GMO51335.1 hypothetical protein BwSH14_72890 [Bradyrhizobium ottawaense]GMO83280.1 hypothetical protein BwSH17_61190 [Bradyrhizobium ottawaense]